MGIYSSDRVEVTYKERNIIAITNVATDFPEKTVGLYEEVQDKLKTIEGETVTLRPAERPESLGFIRNKMIGRHRDREDRQQSKNRYTHGE